MGQLVLILFCRKKIWWQNLQTHQQIFKFRKLLEEESNPWI